jgi:hypothetical protein
MPQILREIDVAVVPNRFEGGTNLVAMECMACGMPVILSANTGYLVCNRLGLLSITHKFQTSKAQKILKN